MKVVSLSEARAKFCELVRLTEKGESICISLRGKPVAMLGALQSSSKAVGRGARSR